MFINLLSIYLILVRYVVLNLDAFNFIDLNKVIKISFVYPLKFKEVNLYEFESAKAWQTSLSDVASFKCVKNCTLSILRLPGNFNPEPFEMLPRFIDCSTKKIQIRMRCEKKIQGLNIVKSGSKQFYFSLKKKATWHNSLKFCRMRGMRLGTVEDAATERLIARYLNKTANTKALKTAPQLVTTIPTLQARTTAPFVYTTKPRFPIFGIIPRQTTTLATTTIRTTTAPLIKTTIAITSAANINITAELKNKFPLIKLWVAASNHDDIQNFYWTELRDSFNFTFWKEQDVQYDNQCVFLSNWTTEKGKRDIEDCSAENFFFCTVKEDCLGEKCVSKAPVECTGPWCPAVQCATNMTFLKAREMCCRFGMDLLSVDSIDEQKCLFNIFSSTAAEEKEMKFWTSGSDEGCDRNYGWCSNGQTLQADLTWIADEPNYYQQSEHCLVISMNAVSKLYGLSDFHCNKSFPFICKKHDISWVRNKTDQLFNTRLSCSGPECPPPCPIQIKNAAKTFMMSKPNGTIFTACNNTQYFFSKKKRFWNEAFQDCCRLNMTLLSLETYSEFECLKNLYQREFSVTRQLWTSGSDRGCPFKFAWCGSGSEFPLYVPWAKKQPDNNQKQEFCVSMTLFASEEAIESDTVSEPSNLPPAAASNNPDANTQDDAEVDDDSFPELQDMECFAKFNFICEKRIK